MQAIQHLQQNYCLNLTPENLETISTVLKIAAVAAVIFAAILESVWVFTGSACLALVSFVVQQIEIAPPPKKQEPFNPFTTPASLQQQRTYSRTGSKRTENMRKTGSAHKGNVPPAPPFAPPILSSGKRKQVAASTMHVRQPRALPTTGMTMLQELQMTLRAKKQASSGLPRSPSAPNLLTHAEQSELPVARKLNFGKSPPGGKTLSHNDALLAAIRKRKIASPPFAQAPFQQPSQFVKKSAEKRGKPLAPPAKPQQFAPPPSGFGAELFAKVQARKKDEPKGLPRSPSAPNLGAVAKPGKLKLPIGGASFLDAIRGMKKDNTPPNAAPLEQQVVVDADHLAISSVNPSRVPPPPPDAIRGMKKDNTPPNAAPLEQQVVVDGDHLAVPPVGSLRIPTPPPLPASAHRRRYSDTEVSQLEVVEDNPPPGPNAFQTPAPTMKELMFSRRTAMRGTHSSLGSVGNRSYHSDDEMDTAIPAQTLDFEEQDLPPPADGDQLPQMPSDEDVQRAKKIDAMDLAVPAPLLFSSQEFADSLAAFKLRKTVTVTSEPPQTERPAHRRLQKLTKTQGSDGFTDDEDDTSETDSDVDPTQRAALMAQLAQKLFGQKPPDKPALK